MQNFADEMAKKDEVRKGLENEVARINTQVEVQNAHLTSQKQNLERLKDEVGATKQALAEVSKSDLAKKVLLLKTELDLMRSEYQS